MALDFPASPTQGQTFQDPATGIVWVFDTGKWRSGAGGGAYLPLSGGALTGSLTGTTGAFSGVVSGADPPAGDSSGKLATTAWINANRPQNRNRIINGNFLIDQYNYGALVPIGGSGYVCDRWAVFSNPVSKYSFQTIAAGQNSNAILTSLSAYTSAAADRFILQQAIEGFNCNEFQFGVASAQPITLSFLFATSIPGTYSGSICSGGSITRSYVFSFNIIQASVYTPISITIPGDTIGGETAYSSTNSAAFWVRFDLGCGVNLRTAPGAWVVGDYVGAVGATSLVAANGAQVWITNVQLELGTQATPFDWRPFGEELALCQRYYCTRSTHQLGGASGTNITLFFPYTFPVVMRAAPTVMLSMTGGTSYTDPSAVNVAADGFAATATGTTTSFYVAVANWTATAEL